MKTIFVICCISFISATSFASQISVIVDGQSYSCTSTGIGSSDCAGKANGFSKTLEACMKNTSGSFCANEYWPKYKQNNPNCIADAIPACLDACMKNSSGSFCAAQCQ